MMRLDQALESLALLATAPPEALSGGDMAKVWRVQTTQGAVVAKADDAERLDAEAEGLAALRAAGSGLQVPEVIGCEGGWLIMEALEAGRHDPAMLGEGLRRLQASTAKDHGWWRDNACGRTPQPNAPLSDGRAFQRERRLLPLIDACMVNSLLSHAQAERLRGLAHDLETWLPDAPACLVHGDLWSGNVLYSAHGPALIDPAVYRHYPEVDVAMLTLFGDPGPAFFEAYWPAGPASDWPRREALFQLYPVLNHLLLFGRGFHRAVMTTADRVASA